MRTGFIRGRHESFTSVVLLGLSVVTLQAQQNPAAIVHEPSAFAISSPLRDAGTVAGPQAPGIIHSLPRDPARQSYGSSIQSASGSNFFFTATFNGIGNGFPNFTVSATPPDANLAVGATQVVQWANQAYAVFDKSTGALQAGPISTDTLWASLGGSCANSSNADTELIILWDKQHQRWLFSQNTLTDSPFYSCVAVSTSADALGSYYLYAFPQGALFPESPKWGIWPNGYYQTQGEFSGSGFAGPELCAYHSAKLVAGDRSAEQICFTLSPSDGLPVPADIDSVLGPPANEDEFFMSLWDSSHLSLYSLHPDYQNPQNSTVTGNNGAQLITVPAFTPACNGAYAGQCVPQKDVSQQLQVLGDRLMYRLAYWEDTPLSSVRATPPLPLPSQHWYVVHDSTAATGNEAPRWYEFTAPIRAIPVTSLALFQSGAYSPDSNYRWMGSIARDKNYDILLGYSESSSAIYPAVAVTGRILTDPLGTMESEMTLNGAGSQLDASGSWGNFTSMRIDEDGCTFWYTNEYYMATLSRDWSTQILSAVFLGCR